MRAYERLTEAEQKQAVDVVVGNLLVRLSWNVEDVFPYETPEYEVVHAVSERQFSGGSAVAADIQRALSDDPTVGEVVERKAQEIASTAIYSDPEAPVGDDWHTAFVIDLDNGDMFELRPYLD